ncbi:acyl-ACP thioesterase [Anaerococcus sp. AGMB00486]|uniref:Acyl-ACP thioesterase n=2 Tax=Anaerococcus TaxID=165779 RepID=A0ABX2NC19_9FIRM|nr:MULTISPECIES: acyl-ACP thioesterase domain-containing protein [Anaerococcus]MDY3006865.1 thioesterase [Anaerococcus porci]MSS77808.1 acyl-ACP thioesterase [Anaerococcus porci]NVF12242.1 acyl-ACP thioesterase [Anaerococcus faecalis]
MKTSKEFIIENFLTNSDGYLKMKYLLGLMFEVSFDQADKLEDKNLMKDKRWIVYSWDIKINEPIKARDKLKITTFAIDMKRFYANRNFIIERDGETIGLAFCSFLLFDLNKMRAIKIPDFLIKAYGKEEPAYIGKRQKYSKNFEEAQKIYIRKNDIDINGHVNNASYMDLIREISDIKDQDIGYINIVYKNEIRDKNFVLGEIGKEENEESYRIISEDGKIYTYGKIGRRNV